VDNGWASQRAMGMPLVGDVYRGPADPAVTLFASAEVSMPC